MIRLYLFKSCKCGRYHNELPENYKSCEGLTYFQCECGSTLTVSSKLLTDQLMGNDWKSRLESGEYDVPDMINTLRLAHILTWNAPKHKAIAKAIDEALARAEGRKVA